MTQTLQSSPTLRQAAARVREAQSVVGEASAANGPNTDLNASTQRQRVPQNVNMGLGYPHKPIYESSNSLGLNTAYEFDWWGKYRNQVNAAKAQVNAARAEQEQAALTLTSSVASAYYLLQSNLALEKLLQQEVNNNERLTALRQQRYQAGLTGVDVPQQTRAQSDVAKQQILQLQSQIEQLRHQLAALAGGAERHAAPASGAVARRQSDGAAGRADGGSAGQTPGHRRATSAGGVLQPARQRRA